MSRHTGARELVERVLDRGSWTSWDAPVVDPLSLNAAYAEPVRSLAAQHAWLSPLCSAACSSTSSSP